MTPLSRTCLLVLLVLCSCQRPAADQEVSRLQLPAATSEEFTRMWESCLAVLRQHRFEIDRKDLYAGVIASHPETSQFVLEFWRHDVDTPYDLLESSLHTIRRWAEIKVSPLESTGEYELEVAVYKERLRSEERQVTNTAAALRAFSPELPTVTGRKFDPQSDAVWTPVGRDPAMEQRLASRIQATYQGRE